MSLAGRSSLVVVLVAACSGSPAKPPVEPVAEAKPAEPAAPAKPAEPPAPPPPQPLDLKLPASKPTVKLVDPGRGKRTALKLAPKQGDKQAIELALDFTTKQTNPDGTPGQDQIAPTIVLAGDAEVKDVTGEGAANVTWTVASADARDVTGELRKAEEVRPALQAFKGLQVTSAIASNGDSEAAIHLDNMDPNLIDVLKVLVLSYPTFPSLPKEPIGVGAKWTATLDTSMMDAVSLTETTTYELKEHKGSTWTIKTTTKVAGKDQDVGQTKLQKITGSGSGEITITDGALFPKLAWKRERSFTAATDKGKVDVALKTNAAITPATPTTK